jgi:hypothetical protein
VVGVFGLVFIVIGIAVVIFCVKTIVDGMKRGGWQETAGIVRESPIAVKEVGGFRVTTKSWSSAQPTTAYEYEVGGRRYTGRGIAMVRETRSFFGGPRSNMAGFAEGAQIPVYYDPADPSRSATFKGGFGCAAVIGIVVGLFFMLFGWMFMSF